MSFEFVKTGRDDVATHREMFNLRVPVSGDFMPMNLTQNL
jgi:hypothetical protein